LVLSDIAINKYFETSGHLQHYVMCLYNAKQNNPHSQNKSQIHKGKPYGSKIDTTKMVHNQPRELLIQQDPSHVYSSIKEIIAILYFKNTSLLFRNHIPSICICQKLKNEHDLTLLLQMIYYLKRNVLIQ
jgi:hypothetical protein